MFSNGTRFMICDVLSTPTTPGRRGSCAVTAASARVTAMRGCSFRLAPHARGLLAAGCRAEVGLDLCEVGCPRVSGECGGAGAEVGGTAGAPVGLDGEVAQD